MFIAISMSRIMKIRESEKKNNKERPYYEHESSLLMNFVEKAEFDLFRVFFLTVQTGSPQTPPIFQDILHLLHTMAARSQESFNTGSCNKDLTHHKPVWLCHHARSEPP